MNEGKKETAVHRPFFLNRYGLQVMGSSQSASEQTNTLQLATSSSSILYFIRSFVFIYGQTVGVSHSPARSASSRRVVRRARIIEGRGRRGG